MKIFSIQRDVLVQYKDDYARINFMLLDSEQRLADAFCNDLRIPIDHMIVVNIDGFVDIINSIGGIDIDVPIKVRDVYSGLDLEAGKHHLNGRDALKYVRSRHPEYYIDN